MPNVELNCPEYGGSLFILSVCCVSVCDEFRAKYSDIRQKFVTNGHEKKITERIEGCDVKNNVFFTSIEWKNDIEDRSVEKRDLIATITQIEIDMVKSNGFKRSDEMIVMVYASLKNCIK